MPRVSRPPTETQTRGAEVNCLNTRYPDLALREECFDFLFPRSKHHVKAERPIKRRRKFYYDV